MADILILGGTRNLGHITALRLLEDGNRVAVLNRGVTADELPSEVERIRGSRGDTQFLKSSIGDRDFDMVVDMTTYTGADAREAVEIFAGHTPRYVFISSGQVYLVRENARRPFRESDYEGAVMPAPPEATADYDAWKYGVDKRDAEAVFLDAAAEDGFPVTTLRLPMVASERDHYGRIQGYFARLLDGGPLLIPDEPGLPLRHVYAGDVARLIVNLCRSRIGLGIGSAHNISHGESMSIDEYLRLLSNVSGRPLRVSRVSREVLNERGLLPACSPFSGRWMSELDNSVGLNAFAAAVEYTSPDNYHATILEDYERRWMSEGRIPSGYFQRSAEL